MTGRYRLRAERDAHGERLLKPGGIGEWFFIIACVGLSWLGFGLIFDDPKGDGSNIFFGLLIAISCLAPRSSWPVRGRRFLWMPRA